MTRRLPAVFGLLTVCIASAVMAYPRAVFDREPNNTPEQADRFRGEAQVIGSLPPEDVDLFWWVLDDAESDRLWTLELVGEAESAIGAELVWPAEEAEAAVAEFGAPAADTASAEQQLIKLRINSRRPEDRRQNLLVPPGEHLLRFQAEGGSNEYRLTLTDSGRVNIRDSIDPDDEQATLVSPGRQWFYQVNRPTVRFDLDSEPSDALWRVSVLAELGAQVQARIIDPQGQPITDAVSGQPLQHSWGRTAMPAGSQLEVERSDGEPIGRIGISIEQDGQRVAEDSVLESETDFASSEEQAVVLEPHAPRNIQLESSRRVWLGFEVDETLAQRRLHIDISGEDDGAVTTCLSPIGSRKEVCRDGVGSNLFQDMLLPEGGYSLSVRMSRRSDPLALSVQLRDSEALPENRAIEPNDDRDWAALFQPDLTMEGHLSGSRSAWFSWHVSGEAQLWRIEADGDDLHRLAIYQAGQRNALAENNRGRRSSEEGLLMLDNQWLLPGRYQLRVDGQDSDYRLSVSPLGQPEPGWEREPNDSVETANEASIGEPMRGRFHSPRDEDYYYLYNPGRNRLVFELIPPEGGSAQMEVEWQGSRILRTPESREPLRFANVLPAGELQIKVSGEADPGQAYALTVGFAAPWQQPDDVMAFMPAPWLAHSFPADGHYHKQLGNIGSSNEYLALPVTEHERTIQVQASTRHFQIIDQTGQTLDRQELEQDNHWQFTLPGNTQSYLQMRSRVDDGEYRIEDPALTPEPPANVRADLSLSTEQVAAYSPLAQRLTGTLEVRNLGDDSIDLPIELHASHHGWQAEGLNESVTLQAGQQQQLRFDLLAPADLPATAPLMLYASAGGVVAQAQADVTVGLEPVNPQAVRQRAEQWHGLADLAWSALGAQFLDPESGETVDERYQGRRVWLQFLHDGLATAGSHIVWSQPLPSTLPPLELAGDGGELHAFVFNQRSNIDHGSRWRDVEIRWGDRPDALPNSMTVQLEAGDGEQFFPLDQPATAKYLQLRPINSWGSGSNTGTSLFRALGKPAQPLADQRHNLLDYDLGGHWIYSRPDGATQVDFPWEGRSKHRGERIRGRQVDVAYAFLQHRIARLERLVWQESNDHEGELIESVRVYTATESPVGPWIDHGEWPLQRDGDLRTEFRFTEQPARARYLRLVFDEPESGDSRNWRVPLDIRAYEADTLGSGQSALAYWGMDDQHGPWEPPSEAITEVEDYDSTPQAPRQLDQSITAQLDEPNDVRSYLIELTDPDNSLRFALQESFSGRLQAQLHSADGEPIELEFKEQDGQRMAEVVGIEPGQYRLDITMPPRSIAFLWDGSGSVAAYQPAIYQAMGRFAEGLQTGKEVANLMPLGGPLLINDWAENATEINTTLTAYNNTFSSSNSEPALKQTSRALEKRDGERVVFLITDAEQTGRDLSVWDDLERVRPRVFAMEINHGGRRDTLENRWYQGLMKTWANVGNGSYRYATGRTDLIRGFEAGMRELRQPTRFSLSVSRDYQAPPQPGQLSVMAAGEQPVIGGSVVHLIFDASGSMLRRMEGGRRIDVAKQIVRDMVGEHIPEHVPLALRAYGHTQAHSCETELLVKPEVGNHGDVITAINRMQAINLSRTPLAASLDAVLSDLSDYQDQTRLVIMLTDGEETCDGDVAESVEKLIDQGLNVRLNIVGFHIDEVGLQADFERFAQMGGGEYFDSRDAEGLAESMASALAAPFRVFDQQGQEVARGRVDGPGVALPVGEYELLVESEQGEHRQSVTIAPGGHSRVRIEQ